MRRYLYNLATDEYKGLTASLVKVFLFILSLIYGLIVRILSLFQQLKPYRLNCKVISIGNITWGGTGKTLVVEFIAWYLKQQGRKIAVLSRGYKRKAAGRKPQAASYKTIGDEPYMLQKHLQNVPILVDADRIRAARQAIADYSVDTVILDDGFQQWKLKKDLEIVTVDVTNPFGNRHLIPRGILREPLSCLKRADIFVLTKTNLNPDFLEIKDFLKQVNPRAEIFESLHKPKGFYRIDKPDELLNLDILKGQAVALVSGIADPDSFENLIESLGIHAGLSFRFPDHHSYTQKDLDKIAKESDKKNIKTLVTTEKDAVRLLQLSVASCQLSVFVLAIALRINKNEEEFANRLLRLYSR